MPKISVIITTYNRPDALILVLNALAEQQLTDFEVIVADDGSTEATAKFIQQLSTPYDLQHVWQEDQGFRAAKARNLAVMAANGDYLVFLDGDCIPRIDFIAKHNQLAELGYFVVGNRVLFNEKFTQQVIKSTMSVWTWPIKKWLSAYLNGYINRLSPLFRLPFIRKYCRQTWRGVKTCNLGVWKKDFNQINGFDEKFQGWGHEDADLAVRLLKSGIRRKNGRFAIPVLHLWHHEETRNPDNWQRFKQRI
ncbi:glycosyltransferase family 2 protein [Candidatus Halobeggiatoa sp. HSG11]|nr:glycosyltransferase family 2 protein [Candidatus Halobeggiatoa sp. HSG11]